MVPLGKMLMNNDIRIAVDAPDHPKIRKLRARLTDSAFLYLFYLWRHTARYCPDGKLKGMDKEDIELASEWPGERGIFVDTLIELRLLEYKNEEYLIHDWKDWNPYAANAPKRKQAAKKAACLKWNAKMGNNKRNRSERLSLARQKGRHTKLEWNEMLSFFSGICVKCEGESGLERVDKDHIIPIYQGGSDSIKNLQPLCAKCNAGKGPNNHDYRADYCRKHGLILPLEWQANACGTHALMSPPSPVPVPVPEPNTKTKPCRQWLDDDVELKLARWFIKLLDDRQYEWKGGKKPDEQKWAIEFDKLIRIDKREPKRIAEVFKWCQAPGNFWRKNILSPHKLRSQWGALTEAIKAEQQPKISVTPRRSQDGWLIYPPDGGGRNLCNKHKISMPAGQKCPECAEAENAHS
jgi:5-methylcytosine-specific restriction endonuclease McrA